MENGAAERHPAIYAILTIVGEILKIVKRIDDMIRRRRERRRFNANIQEACFHYWVLGQQPGAGSVRSEGSSQRPEGALQANLHTLRRQRWRRLDVATLH